MPKSLELSIEAKDFYVKAGLTELAADFNKVAENLERSQHEIAQFSPSV